MRSALGFVNSGILLGFSGVIVVVVAVLASYGLMGWIGVKLSPLNTNIVPFLAIGIGISEVFMIIRAITR